MDRGESRGIPVGDDETAQMSNQAPIQECVDEDEVQCIDPQDINIAGVAMELDDLMQPIEEELVFEDPIVIEEDGPRYPTRD